MPNVYDIGQEIRLWGTFADTAGTAVDPGTVHLLFIPAGGPGTTYSYASGSISRQATGTYYFDYIATAGGYWYWGWQGSGTITTTDYGRDFIRYMGTNQ